MSERPRATTLDLLFFSTDPATPPQSRTIQDPLVIDEINRGWAAEQELAKLAGGVPDNALLSEADLARLFPVKRSTLRKRLAAFRGGTAGGWEEVPQPGCRGPHYLYLVSAVRHLLGADRLDTDSAPKKNRKSQAPSAV
jgi:hypothetical protein